MKNQANRGGCYPPPSSICLILHILRKPNSLIATSLHNSFDAKSSLKIDLYKSFYTVYCNAGKIDMLPTERSRFFAFKKERFITTQLINEVSTSARLTFYKNLLIGKCPLSALTGVRFFQVLTYIRTRNRRHLYSNRVTSENKGIHTPPLSPPFKVEVFVVLYR